MSCGDGYDQEVYGQYATTLKKLITPINPNCIVKITGWETDQPLFSSSSITEVSVYNFYPEELSAISNTIKTSRRAFREFHPYIADAAGQSHAVITVENPAVDLVQAAWTAEAEIHYVIHHNQTLDVLSDYLDRPEQKGQQPTLIHVDTHSDIYRDPSCAPGHIGNYINDLLIEKNAQGDFLLGKDFYWVVPDSQAIAPHFTENDCYGQEEQSPYQKKYYIDRHGILFTETARDRREIILHVCKLADLPELQKTKVILDLDLDYFSCKNRFNPSQAQLSRSLNLFNQRINTKLRPDIAIICQSPDFTPTEDCEFLIRHFQEQSAKRHITADATSFRHMGIAESDLYYLDFINEKRELLTDTKTRQLLMTILKKRQLYEAAALCTEPGPNFHFILNGMIARMLVQQTGLNARDEELLENIVAKYKTYSTAPLFGS